jgi:hypothetical protein
MPTFAQTNSSISSGVADSKDIFDPKSFAFPLKDLL